MSWSVYEKGSRSEILPKVADKFEQAKRNTAHVPSEQATVELAKTLVMHELNAPFAANVSVEASGSCYFVEGHPEKSTSQVSIKVQAAP